MGRVRVLFVDLDQRVHLLFSDEDAAAEVYGVKEILLRGTDFRLRHNACLFFDSMIYYIHEV